MAPDYYRNPKPYSDARVGLIISSLAILSPTYTGVIPPDIYIDATDLGRETVHCEPIDSRLTHIRDLQLP